MTPATLSALKSARGSLLEGAARLALHQCNGPERDGFFRAKLFINDARTVLDGIIRAMEEANGND